MVSAALAALRDGAFGRKVLNFVISAYALTTIYSAIFTPGRIRDGEVLPKVEAHQHIMTFVRWIGLAGPADWLQSHLVAPALSAPLWTCAVGVVIIVASAAVQALRGPSISEIPAQPAYGVVLGVTILVDLHGSSLFWTAVLAASVTYLGLLIFREGAWDSERFLLPLVDAVVSPILVILSAPLRVCAYIAIAPTDRPMRVRVVNSDLDPVKTRAVE